MLKKKKKKKGKGKTTAIDENCHQGLKKFEKKKKKNTETLGFLESFVANSSITGARICFSCERFVH